MKEEDKILRKAGTENCFKTPEGYFESFNSEMISKLPEPEKHAFRIKEPTPWDRFKPWVYMAAMFAGAALIIKVASSEPTASDVSVNTITQTDTQQISDEYIDAVLDMSMIDDYSLYIYLTAANTEIN